MKRFIFFATAFLVIVGVIFVLMSPKKLSSSCQDCFKLAKLGDAEAQYQLACHYFQGNGCSKSERKGMKWLKISSEQNYAKAQCRLGDRLLGDDRDLFGKKKIKGWDLIEKSAGQNYAPSLCLIGYASWKGYAG